MEELEEEDQLALAGDRGVVVPLGVNPSAGSVDGPRSGGYLSGFPGSPAGWGSIGADLASMPLRLCHLLRSGEIFIFSFRLNQSSSGSSSGIHSLIACYGGSMGSMVSMSNGGGDGRGSWTMPSQRPGRLSKKSTCPGRLMAPAGFMGALLQGIGEGRLPRLLG